VTPTLEECERALVAAEKVVRTTMAAAPQVSLSAHAAPAPQGARP
jgi:hypothetical protein